MQYYQENIALGSKVQFFVVSDGKPLAVNKLFKNLWQQTFRFERQFSRFLPGSELSTFNRNAGTKQYISPEFRAILEASRRLSEETTGLYNPFILPALQAAGYAHSRVKGHETDTVDDHSGKTVVGIDRLEIGNDWARIPYGTALDLGGCGKGYLADMLVKSLDGAVTGYWLSLGGDIAVGGRDGAGNAWQVAIEQVGSEGQQNIGYVKVPTSGSYAVATSGTTVHHGKHGNQNWHHIIDPRSLKPAKTDIQLATICSTSALRADVLASCAVIVGSRNAEEFLQTMNVSDAVLQSTRGKQPNVTVFGKAIQVDGSVSESYNNTGSVYA